VHVTRRTALAVAEQPHQLHHCPAGPLVGDAVNRDHRDAIVRAHPPMQSTPASVTPPTRPGIGAILAGYDLGD
jgi:hypothetical protein